MQTYEERIGRYRQRAPLPIKMVLGYLDPDTKKRAYWHLYLQFAVCFLAFLTNTWWAFLAALVLAVYLPFHYTENVEHNSQYSFFWTALWFALLNSTLFGAELGFWWLIPALLGVIIGACTMTITALIGVDVVLHTGKRIGRKRYRRMVYQWHRLTDWYEQYRIEHGPWEM